jgi:hypothetical protein
LRCDHELVDKLLEQAMEPVLRDLRSAGIPAPRVKDDDWAGDPDWASAMLWSPGGSGSGSGTGVRVSRSASEIERVMEIADQIQEWAIEELWGRAPTNWPPCPNHPDTHPMKATTRTGVAVWACPADQMPFSPIGEL